MSYNTRDLHPGSLYLTLALPGPACYYPRSEGPYWRAKGTNPIDPSSYEIGCAEGRGNEEFGWALYWHRGYGQLGTLYTLERDMPLDFFHAGRPSYTFVKHETRQSPRLNRNVVCLVRLLRVPQEGHVADEIPLYLDWLAADMANEATRTCIWALAVYVRVRRRVVNITAQEDAMDLNLLEFDVTACLGETLKFAYQEVKYSFGGQLPRPILVSGLGIEYEEVKDDSDDPYGAADGESDDDSGGNSDQNDDDGWDDGERVAREIGYAAAESSPAIDDYDTLDGVLPW